MGAAFMECSKVPCQLSVETCAARREAKRWVMQAGEHRPAFPLCVGCQTGADARAGLPAERLAQLDAEMKERLSVKKKPGMQFEPPSRLQYQPPPAHPAPSQPAAPAEESKMMPCSKCKASVDGRSLKGGLCQGCRSDPEVVAKPAPTPIPAAIPAPAAIGTVSDWPERLGEMSALELEELWKCVNAEIDTRVSTAARLDLLRGGKLSNRQVA